MPKVESAARTTRVVARAARMVPAVERAVRILNLIAEEPEREWGVSEISGRLKLNKSTAHAILATLAHHRLLDRDPTSRRYRPGPALHGLASALAARLEVTMLARPLLQKLLEESGETVFLAVLQDGHLTLVDKAESRQDMGITSPLGRRLPHSAGALGKVFHAWMDAAALGRLLTEVPLRRFTKRTVIDPAAYRRQLRQVREEGVAYDDQEYLEGVRAVAVPLLGSRGEVEAAVCVVGPSSRLSLERLRELGELARQEMAARIGSQAGQGLSGDGRREP